MLEYTPARPELTDREWNAVKQLVDGHDGGARVYDMRAIIASIRYVLTVKCAWCDLPGHGRSYVTVFNHYQRLRWSGRWEKIAAALDALAHETRGGGTSSS